MLIMPFRVRLFHPRKVFYNKRVAVVGPADSAFDRENGKNIDGYDYVIRINKALVTWNRDSEKYLGTRTDILFHNFHENMDSGGGGPLDLKLFKNAGVTYLIQPRFDRSGWRTMLNYFKKYLNTRDTIYVLPFFYYKRIKDMFDEYHPTKGFCALYATLTSPCKEVFITGFTFFKTPYAKGYRDTISDTLATRKHIQDQGLHDIEMEYQNFLRLLKTTACQHIRIDQRLHQILSTDAIDPGKKVNVLE